MVPLGLVIGDQIGHAQTGNIEGSRVIARSIPSTLRIDTIEPRRPVVSLLAVGGVGGEVGLCGLVAPGARMGGAASLDIPAADTQQITLVAQDAPELASNLRVIAPIAEAPAHAASSPDRLEGGQVLPTDQPTIIQQRQQDQQVGSQMRQFAVAFFILFPAKLDASFIRIDVVLPFLEMAC